MALWSMNVNIFMEKLSISVQIISYLGASDEPIKKIDEHSLKTVTNLPKSKAIVTMLAIFLCIYGIAC